MASDDTLNEVEAGDVAERQGLHQAALTASGLVRLLQFSVVICRYSNISGV